MAMKKYKVEIGLFTYSVNAENKAHARLLAAYKHKEAGRGKGVPVSKVARLLTRVK